MSQTMPTGPTDRGRQGELGQSALIGLSGQGTQSALP